MDKRQIKTAVSRRIIPFKRPYLFWVLTLFTVACIHEAPDFKKIDKEIATGHLHKAQRTLQKLSSYSYTDSLVQKKIAYRLFKIEKDYFFKEADSLLRQARWMQSARILTDLSGKIKKFPLKKQRKYRFDLYYKMYIADSARADTAAAFSDLKKAVENWSDNRELLQKAFGRLCFYYAERRQFIKAREMMDKGLRIFDLNALSPDLRLVFFEYMDGRFKESFLLLKKIKTAEKYGLWNQLEKFLREYGHRLTLKERFKLW